MSPAERLRAAMAARPMRLAHLVWHGVRDLWEQLPDHRRGEFVARFGRDWVPPRPSRDASGAVKLRCGAGRDFLYMHRLMIEHARAIVGPGNPGLLCGWAAPPAAGDPEYRADLSLPAELFPAKTPQHWNGFVQEATELTSAESLRRIDLDELGTRLEYRIHAAMHERFGGFDSRGMLRVAEVSLTAAVDAEWDDPRYDSLLDAYAAHVHPWFWRIHGWIDAQVDRWAAQRRTRVDWAGAWAGPMGHHHPLLLEASPAAAAGLREIAGFLGASGFSGFFRPGLL